MPKPKRKTTLNYKPLSLDDVSEDDDSEEDEHNDEETPPTSNANNGGGGGGGATSRPTMMNSGKSLTDVMAKYDFDDDSSSSDDSTKQQQAAALKNKNKEDRPTSIYARPEYQRNISTVSFQGTENLETGSAQSFDSEYSDKEASNIPAAEPVVDEATYPRPKFKGLSTSNMPDDSSPPLRHQSTASTVVWGTSSNIKTGSILHRSSSLDGPLPLNGGTYPAGYSMAAARVAMEDEGSSSDGGGSKGNSVTFMYRPNNSNTAAAAPQPAAASAKKMAPAESNNMRSASTGTVGTVGTVDSKSSLHYDTNTNFNNTANKSRDNRLSSMSAASNMSSASTIQYPGVADVGKRPREGNVSAAKVKNGKKDYSNRLTKISAMYDMDGDGVLDEIEQAMRDRDLDGDGQIDNAEVHKIIMDHLKNEREVGMYKKVTVALVCLVCILALSNFGTSWATVILTKEVVAEPESGAITSAKSGEVMGYQEIGHEIDLEPLTDEEFEERRLLVDREMSEDMDHEDHIHRRLGKKDADHACTCTKIAYDHGKIKERELQQLIRKCDGVNTVALKRMWKSGDMDVDTICGPGTVVVKKGKKKNNKKKTKTKVVEDQIKFRRKGKNKNGKGGGDKEISFDCKNGYCYGSGQTLLQQEGHPCDLSRDRNGAGECDDGLICYDPDGDRFGTGTCVGLVQYARKNSVCDLDFGVDACEDGYACYSTQLKRSRVVGVVNTGTCQKVTQKVRNQDVCDASFGGMACEAGYTCIGENGRELNGRGIGYCQRLVVKQRSGGLCDLGLGRDSCDDGFYCMDSMLIRSGRNGGGNGGSNGGAASGMTNAIISGPSGTIVAGSGNRAAPGSMAARSIGTGECTRTAGRGGVCESNEECGWNGRCVGLGADTAMGGVIRGASGTIVWGNGGAATGICS